MDLFLRAAELQGRSLTDCVIAGAQQAALETVRTHEALRLSERDRRTFVAAILASPAPGTTLARAARGYRARTGQ